MIDRIAITILVLIGIVGALLNIRALRLRSKLNKGRLVAIEDAISSAQRGAYLDGLSDATIMCLELLLGHPRSERSVAAGIEYSGPLPDELKDWAGDALDKARLERKGRR